MTPDISGDKPCRTKQCPEEGNSSDARSVEDMKRKAAFMNPEQSTNEVNPVKEDVLKKEGLLKFKTELIWSNVVHITVAHAVALYCALTFDYLLDWRTTFWIWLTYVAACFGVTAGTHRLWTHRSFKATEPFKVLLIVCYTMAGQNSVFNWVRDHRVHHKYTDTDADPHNSKRGFFFSHVGWLMMKKHPEVIEKGRQIDMSDILADRVVTLANRHFTILKIMFTFILPSLVPVYGWNETWYRAFVSQAVIRYILVLNATWSVNSAAHLWGTRPYNGHIRPSENVIVSVLATGEGWHNYHHVFPWDYKASEWTSCFTNLTTVLLNVAAKFGWVYDLKEPPPALVKAVAKRRGDGSYGMWDEVKLLEGSFPTSEGKMQ